MKSTLFNFINFMLFYLCTLTFIFFCTYPQLSFIFTCIHQYLPFSKLNHVPTLTRIFLLASPLTSFFPILNYTHLLCFPKALHIFLILVTYKILSQWQVSVLIISESNYNVHSMELSFLHLARQNKYLMSKGISLFSFPLLCLFAFQLWLNSPI